MAQKVITYQYDNNIHLVFTITTNNIVEPLINAKVLIKFREQASNYEFDRYATITDPNTAECEYVLTAEDLSVPGTYRTEVETTYQNGTVLSSNSPFILSVVEEKYNHTKDINKDT